MSVRFGKDGRRLADTGHGCGCGQCAGANAPRYERRIRPVRDGGRWSSLHRAAVAALRRLSLD